MPVWLGYAIDFDPSRELGKLTMVQQICRLVQNLQISMLYFDFMSLFF